MIDKNTILEMIQEYELMLNVIQRRINMLKQFAGEQTSHDFTKSSVTSKTPVPNYNINNIQQEIANRRQEIMAEIQKIKSNAELQAQQAIKTADASPNTFGNNFMSPLIPSINDHIMKNKRENNND